MSGTTKLEVGVEGMTCGGCARSVDRALRKLDGVVNVTVDLEGRRAQVDAERPLDEASIRESVGKLGFSVTHVSAL